MSSTATAASLSLERWIAVHPLSMVGMADHYTRTASGGSPGAATDPVVGLWLGTRTTLANSNTQSTNTHITVTHAEDVSVDRSAAAARLAHVTLHQAVYERHVVVGWYRVVDGTSASMGPTPEDLLVTQQLATEFATHDSTAAAAPFLLALLLVHNDAKDTDSNVVPLQLFAWNATQHVLVGLDQNDAWSVATALPERLAVEQALRATTTDTSDTTLLHSLQAIHDRLVMVHDYLLAATTTRGDSTVPPPWDAALVRRIQGLVLLQASIHASEENTNDANDTESLMQHLVQHVSTLALTVGTVHDYTDHVRTLQTDATLPHTSGSTRPGGRFFAMNRYP